MRESNRWDAVINSVNYRLKRDEDGSPYRKVVGRSMLEIREILAQGGEQYLSRQDLRTLFQTDWSGGSQWQKPLLSDQSIDSYYLSEGFDTVTEPGNIFPQSNHGADTTTFEWLSNARAIQVSSKEIYWVDDNGGSGNPRVAKWDGSTFSHLTNRFGAAASDNGACWSAAHASIFSFSDTTVDYVTPDSAGGAVIAHGATIYEGATIFEHFGRLLLWTGEKLLEIDDPLGTPAVSTIYNDGMGPDMSQEIITGAADSVIWPHTVRLGLASSEGVWVVKNVWQDGFPTPFIARVDRTEDGTNIGVPVASLPRGTLALGATYHMGSLIIAAATDMTKVFGNDYSDFGYPEITFYHLTNDSLGTIGSPLGGLAPDEAPYVFLGTDKANLYVGGSHSIWVFDAVRGAFHRWVKHDPSGTGLFTSLARTTDAAGTPIQLYTRAGTADWGYYLELDDSGDSATTHTLESNYIDGNLPSELKSLVGVTLMTSGIKANETWTVSIEADDAGSFTSAAVFDTDGAKTTYKALASAMTGYRFRYKIAWTATGDVAPPSRVKGIVLHMVQGEMVTAWQLVIEGGEARNVENEVVRPEDTLSDLEVLASKYQIIEYVDEFKETATTHDVRVDNVSIERKNANEIDRAVVVLTEQDLDN